DLAGPCARLVCWDTPTFDRHEESVLDENGEGDGLLFLLPLFEGGKSLDLEPLRVTVRTLARKLRHHREGRIDHRNVAAVDDAHLHRRAPGLGLLLVALSRIADLEFTHGGRFRLGILRR